YRGAGSSPNKTADNADAWIQAIRHGDSHDQRHRIGGKDQESSVQDRKANAPTGDSAGNLSSRSGLLNNSTVLILLYCFNSTIRICTRTVLSTHGRRAGSALLRQNLTTANHRFSTLSLFGGQHKQCFDHVLRTTPLASRRSRPTCIITSRVFWMFRIQFAFAPHAS